MVTQCPKCQKTQEIPGHYKGQPVKCRHCKAQFAAVEYIDPPEASASTVRDRIDNGLDAVFKAVGGVLLTVIGFVFGLSIIGCAIAAIAEPQLGAIQYLLAVCAGCLVILVFIAAKK